MNSLKKVCKYVCGTSNFGVEMFDTKKIKTLFHVIFDYVYLFENNFTLTT